MASPVPAGGHTATQKGSTRGGGGEGRRGSAPEEGRDRKGRGGGGGGSGVRAQRSREEVSYPFTASIVGEGKL